MSEQPDKFWKRRRVTPQDTLILVKASVRPGDTSINAAYVIAREHALRSRCSEEKAHDLGTEVMVLIDDARAKNFGYLTNPNTFDDDVFNLMVKCRRAGWKSDQRHLKLAGSVAYQLHIEQSTADDADAVSRAIDTPYIRREINRAWATLTPRERLILVMRRIWDLGTTEVARRLGIVEGTVRVELCHGMKKMRSALKLAFRKTRYMEQTRDMEKKP